MNSFAVATKANQGRQWTQTAGVTGTPTRIGNGKYRVSGGQTYDDVLRVDDHLIARERAAMGGASTGAPAAPAAGNGG